MRITTDSQQPPGEPNWVRAWARRFFELVGLCSFAIAQPVLDVLGRSATFFVAQGASLGGILALVLLLVLGIPLTVIFIERIVAFVSTVASRALHVVVLGILFALAITPPVARAVGGSTAVWAAIASCFFALAVFAYSRFHRFRQYLSWIALSAVPFGAVFLFFSPVRELIVPQRHTIRVGQARTPTPVVVLVLDELQLGSLLTPEGEIDGGRYPNFAKLAQSANWYPNATTTGESTQWALPSLMTGQWISEEKTPTSGNYPKNLFTLVEGSQDIYAHEFVTRICAPSTCTRVGTDPGLRSLLLDAAVVYLHIALPGDVGERVLPPLTGRWAGFAGAAPRTDEPNQSPKSTGSRSRKEFVNWVERDIRSDPVSRFEKMLQSIDQSDSPALWYMHMAMPHVPWRFLPTMQTYETERTRAPGLEGEQWIDSQAVVDHAYQRYLLQLRFTDKLLERLVKRLADEDLFDSSLLIVAADHGVSFRRSASRRLIDDENVGDMVPVPLFVKYPGQTAGRVDQRNAELVDVLPTILDVLGIDADMVMDGTSLRSSDPLRPTKRVFSGKSGPHVYGDSITGIERIPERIEMLFGSGGTQDDLYAFGPHRNLMGMAVSPAAALPPDGSAQLTLSSPDAFSDVEPQGPFVPALVKGFFTGAIDGEEPVAVSLNGKIAGLGWTYKEGGRVRFGIIVSPRYFVRGRNHVAIYRILADGTLQLVPRPDSAAQGP